MAHEQKHNTRAWRDRRRALKENVPALLAMAWASGRRVVAAAVVGRVCGALVPVAMLGVAKQILDALQAEFTGAALREDFWWLVALEAGLAFGGAAIGRVTGFFDGLFADQFTRHVSVRLIAHASRLDLATFENPAFQDTLERARAQATDRIAMVQSIGTILQQLLTTIGLALVIVAFSPWLLLILVASGIPVFLGESHFAFQGYALSVRQTPIRRQLDYLRFLGTSKEPAKELKLFGLAPFVTSRYSSLSDELYAQNVALSWKRLWAGILLSLLSTASYYAAYAYVVYAAVTGTLSWGSLQMLAGAIAGTSATIQALFGTFSNISDQSLFLTDLVELLRLRPTIATASHARPLPSRIEEIVFENVSFSYPGSARLVLNEVNFRLPAGQRVALVGENGGGKTTIVKLLSRLYDPTAGRILLNGVDLREFDIDDLHRAIGVIFQDFMRYDMTARQNVGIGRIDRMASDSDIELATRKSLANAVIARLPGGYEQLLGRRFEGGVDLSGGEWQKVALARAYLRDAQLLILDEPTAALDAASEYEVFQRFADLTRDKTSLLISHRFSTVRMADRILVLADGVIAEEGHHHELVSQGGRYAGMFELQAASYR